MANRFNPGVDQLARMLTAQKADAGFLAGSLLGSYLKDPFHDMMAKLFKKNDDSEAMATVPDGQLPNQTLEMPTQNNDINNAISIAGIGGQQQIKEDEAPQPQRNLITNEPTSPNSPLLVNSNQVNKANVLGQSLADLGKKQELAGQNIANNYGQVLAQTQAQGQQAAAEMAQQIAQEEAKKQKLLNLGMNMIMPTNFLKP